MFVLIVSCEKPDNTCNCDKPLEDLGWLKTLKNSITDCSLETSIIQATYEKQTVFYSKITDPLYDGLDPIAIFDCKGTLIKTFNMNDPAISTGLSEIKLLYRCKTK